MKKVILNNLPEDHPLRNTKLQGMYHRQKGTESWKEINGNYGIRNATYNMLSKEVWQKHDEFMYEEK